MNDSESTSHSLQFIHKRFTGGGYRATIGADFIRKDLVIDDQKISLQIWDTAGQERFQSLGVAFYRGADACVLVYDVNNARTFENLQGWLSEFKRQCNVTDFSQFTFVLIGNKIDLDERVVSRRQAKAWAQKVQSADDSEPSNLVPMECFETSAKDGTNVEAVFSHIARSVKVAQMDMDVMSPSYDDRISLNRDRRRRSTFSTVSSTCCGV